ncbi:transcription factor bHLH106-like [Cornus florida]|uniref:transcription factor bHLH106-like n=1 Tax=Cornus florida TaxID=4283 RepID=UPI00289D3B69|nr:transcription factor bHLH106-like [Cornus florida]
MFPFENYYGLRSISNRNALFHEPTCMKKKETDGGDHSSSSSGSMITRKKSEQASMKHAVAERIRRNRINTHIQTLRQLLIPDIATKTVKATVLTEAVRQMRELSKRAAEVAEGGGDTGTWSFLFPGESDEATVSYSEEGGEGRMVKVTVCCKDRPGLNRELTEAIRSVGGKAVRAEMATIGGRTKAEVVVQWRDGGGDGEESAESLKRALKAVVENQALGCAGLGQGLSVNGPVGLGHDFRVSKRVRIVGSSDSGWVDGFLY